MPPASNPTDEALLVKAGKQLKVDLSGTPNRHSTNAAAAALGQPFVNPTLLTVQSDALVRLETGSEVEITRLSEVFFDLDSKLVMESGSIITVKDGGVLRLKGNIELLGNSKIQVKSTGKIIVENGSALKLLSDNAMIEIEGELVIINTQFTISGVPNDQKGFLKFHPNATVSAQGSGSIALGEANNFRKVLELAENAQISLPNTLTQFGISYGEIQMAPGSRLMVATKAVFVNARFERLGSTGMHHGVLLSGNHAHQVTVSRFNNASTGLEINLNGNLFKPVLSTNQFNNSQMGLLVHGGGLLINSGSFTGNTQWALQLSALSAATDVNNVTFTNNANGIKVSSTNSHPVSIQGCHLQRAAQGGIGMEVLQGNIILRANTVGNYHTAVRTDGMNARVRLACNELSDAEYGIEAANKSLVDLSNQARNRIWKTNLAMHLDYGALLLQNGMNDFHEQNTLVLLGDIEPGCFPYQSIAANYHSTLHTYYDLPADNNKFEAGLVYPTPAIANSLYTYADGLTANHSCDGIFMVVDVWTPEPVFRACTNCDFSYVSCSQAEPPWWHDVYNEVHLDTDPTSWLVNTPLYPGIELKEAIRMALNDITIDMDQPLNDSLALEKFKQILTANYANMTEAGLEVLAAANQAMNFALANAYQLGLLPVDYGTNPTPLDDKVLTILSFLDYLIEEHDDEGDKAKYAMDKVLLYRLAGHYATALAELHNGFALAHTNANYWDCILNLEWQYFEGTIDATAFAAGAEQCMPYFQARRQQREIRPKPAVPVEPAFGLVISPNPTASSSVFHYAASDGVAQLRITDMQGRVVQHSILDPSSSQIEISALSLPVGVFVAELRHANGRLERAKWVISR